MLSEMPGAEEEALENFRYALHVEPSRIVNFDYPIKFLFVSRVDRWSSCVGTINCFDLMQRKSS